MGTILSNQLDKNKDLIGENCSPRIQVCLCVDTSLSMYDRIQSINRGIRSFLKDIGDNDYAADSVELCIIAFNKTGPVTINEFQTVENIDFKDLLADGKTPLGEAIIMALDKIKRRQELIASYGISFYKPWLIIMSDGAATDDIREAVERTLQLQAYGSLKVLCIAMGESANDLSRFTHTGEVVNLEDFALEDFFSWLSKSMAKQSTASPVAEGEIPELNKLYSMGKLVKK